MTTGFSYISDENFLESFYRNEFHSGVAQETYIYLKRIEDNWGVSILGKARINDFADKLEEMPSVKYQVVGGSLFDDKFTLYSDSEVSRLRQRIGDKHTTLMNEDIFTWAIALGFLIGIIGHKNKKAVVVGVLLFSLGIIGVFL